MTGGEFSGVDIDLLADYVGGALDGTRDEAVVTALVADDPAWRDAHDALTGGMAAVGDELGRLGAAPEPMPADITARLDAALAAMPPLAAASASSDDDDTEVAAGGAEAHPGTRPHLVAVPGGSEAGARAVTGGRRRALRRWAAPMTVAAGVLAIAGIGLGNLFPGPASDSGSESKAAADQASPLMDENSRMGGPASAATTTQILTSGKDYARATLTTEVQTGLLPESSNAEKFNQSGAVPPVLLRLRVRTALQACLDAVTAQHDTGAVSVESVDFARFEGAPAVLVIFAANDGQWAWVSGPDCGTPGAGADTRYQVRVG